MKSLVLVTALLAAGLASPAFADSPPAQPTAVSVSASLGVNNLNGAGIDAALPELNLGAQTRLGAVVLGANLTEDQGQSGVQAHGLAVTAGYALEAGPLRVTPIVGLGYGRFSSAGSHFAANRLDAGVLLESTFQGPVQIYGGAVVGRTFAASTGHAGLYTGLQVGATFKVGPGQIDASYAGTRTPLLAGVNLVQNRFLIGYDMPL
jgi:hypothetical protein